MRSSTSFTMDEANKAVIGKEFITGSSNFSAPGLEARNEFNVELRDFGTEEAQQYFDELWEKAVPLTATDEDVLKLVKIVKEQSVAAAVTPFEAYYLVMKTFLEYQQGTLNIARLDRLLKDAGSTSTSTRSTRWRRRSRSWTNTTGWSSRTWWGWGSR